MGEIFKTKLLFSHQPVCGSVKTQQHRKWSSKERRDRKKKKKRLDRQYKHRSRDVELPLQCITFDSDGDILLLLFYTQKNLTFIKAAHQLDILKKKGFFDAHFKGLV